MLQFVLTTAATFWFGKHTSHSDTGRPVRTSRDRLTSAGCRDNAARLADRALWGADAPLIL